MSILSYFGHKATRYIKRNFLNFALFALVLHIFTPFPIQLNSTRVMKARVAHLIQMPINLIERLGG